MARQPFLIALDFPPTKQMVEDLLLLAEQPVADLRQVADKVAQEQGFLEFSRLQQLATEVFGDLKVARAVANTIYSVSPDDTKRPVSDVKTWSQLNPSESRPVSEETLAAIGERVQLLAQPFPALERRRKAVHLAQLTGIRCDSADILCDIRPVFDPDRTRVEGLLPVVTLRLHVTSQDGDPSVYEVRLTERLLGELAEKADLATKKLRVVATQSVGWVPGGWLGSNETEDAE